MKRYVLISLIVLLLTLIESTFSSYFLILLFCLILFLKGYKHVYLYAFVGGLLLDLFGSIPLGLSSFSFLCIFILLGFMKRFLPNNSTFIVFSFALAVFIYSKSLSLNFPPNLGVLLDFSYLPLLLAKNAFGLLLSYTYSVFTYELLKKDFFRRA